MKINSQDYCVPPDKEVKLDEWPTLGKPLCKSKRFLERIDDPEKNWKFSASDIQERKFWKRYMGAYEECLSATSTLHAPWYVVPADDKDDARLIVSQIVLDSLSGLKMAYPKTTPQRKIELEAIGELLKKE
jgi:Polyphosphate kinase 2 (PPK2)